MDKVRIKDVTLISLACVNYATTIRSLRNCMDKCEFDRVVFLTDIELKEEGIEVIKIERINSKEEYSAFIIKNLYKYFHTKHCLIVQHDGTILNSECWDEGFKDYDVIGAKWLYPEPEPNCANGGFSLKSFKLMEAVATDSNIEILHPEDEILGRLYRRYLEKRYDIKFAPEKVCDIFSYELHAPIQKTFGHHGFFHLPFKEHIILKRTASCGDLIMLEPIVSYYSEQGYQVVLDTLPQFMELFSRYRFKVLHLTAMDNRIKPVKKINFDMSYENKPKQLVLKSYIELTGEEIKLRNSRLNFPVDHNAYLFNKYILIHIDDTGMPHRNCQGVNWAFVVSYYMRLGFQVFQIGKRMNEQVAPYLNTATIETMMFMISGCKLLIGIDSSPAQIAVALDVPVVIFFGSVNWKYRYLPSENMTPIHTPCVKAKTDYCYHNEVSTVGVKCMYNKLAPACVQYDEYTVIKVANKLLKLN